MYIRKKKAGPMQRKLPEKAKLLDHLKKGGFNVPDFIYVPAKDFEKENFSALEEFLENHREKFKVIARSAHPEEESFKGGTFDSLETYADLSGIKYARKRMIKFVNTTNRLSILRQQRFNKAPQIDPEKMGVIVMPFINGSSVMAKMIGDYWEFGYCRDRLHKIQSEPYITCTPHNRQLLQISKDIQKNLSHRCEIEYIISEDDEIHVVQAKDISNIETLEQKESDRSVVLDGLRRIRKRRNYRERPIYVMDSHQLYIDVICKCEDLVLGCEGPSPDIKDIVGIVYKFEEEIEDFALKHERFGILGISVRPPKQLHQIANHYLDDTPDLQKQLSRVLKKNLYKVDIFLSEADTLIALNRHRINLCSHDAYGIDTVRNPLWSVYWNMEKHDHIVKEFKRLGFKTGDSVGIDISQGGKPTVIRL